MLRYGQYLGLGKSRLKVGQYLFLRHGGKIVFFGRFVAVLRAYAALLAGINCMSWGRFLVFNACGGVLWALGFGLGAYLLGHTMHSVTGWDQLRRSRGGCSRDGAWLARAPPPRPRNRRSR